MLYEDIIKRIEEERGISRDEIEKKIEKKMEEFDGLVTKEGAAYIIAHELGIRLFSSSSSLKIKNIIPGLRRVDFVGRVLKVYPVVKYQKDGKENEVQSVLVGDETGRIRIVIWSKGMIDQIKNLEPGDVVKVSGAYSKENMGRAEVHMRSTSKLVINPEGVNLPKLEEIWQKAERVDISTLEEGRFEIKATIVYKFEPTEFEACPICGKKLVGGICEEHGKVEPKKVKMMSIIVDDGTGNTRVTLFRDLAERFNYELGDEVIIIGDSKFNDVSGSYEIIARSIRRANPVEEAKRLIKESF